MKIFISPAMVWEVEQEIERMTEEKVAALEASVAEVQISPRFTPVASPAGDKAVEFLDKAFSQIEEWIDLKIKDSRYKSLILTTLETAYVTVRFFVLKQLT